MARPSKEQLAIVRTAVEYHTTPYVLDTFDRLVASLEATERERDAAQDKALRFDLHQVSIENAEQIACEVVELRAANAALKSQLAEARGALMELRTRLHSAGRRPEECHDMSIIDDVLAATQEPT